VQPVRLLPERWEDGLEDRIPKFAFFPFSGGPRQCIGASFAMMEATLVLAAIVQKFRLSLVPGQVIEPWVIPTMRPKHGMNMLIQAR
jgi:cytochrome P450